MIRLSMDSPRHRQRRALLVLLGTALAGWGRGSDAQPPPDVEIIVPNPAGGSTDEVARIVAAALQEISGNVVGLVHVTGNAGVDGTNAIAASPPDGKVLGMAVSTALVSAKLLTKIARYDPIQDFDWLAIFGAYPNAMVVNESSPAKSLRDWVDVAKRATAPIRYGTFGRGSAGHLAGGFLRKAEGLNLEHVQIAELGTGYALLADGSLDVLFDGVPNALNMVPKEKVRIVGVSSAARVTALPNIVAFGEVWPGRSFEVWIGMVAPKGLPVPVFSEISARFGVMCNDPKYRERFRQAGMRFLGLTGAAAREYIESDFIRTARLIADYGLDAER